MPLMCQVTPFWEHWLTQRKNFTQPRQHDKHACWSCVVVSCWLWGNFLSSVNFYITYSWKITDYPLDTSKWIWYAHDKINLSEKKKKKENLKTVKTTTQHNNNKNVVSVQTSRNTAQTSAGWVQVHPWSDILKQLPCKSLCEI